MTHLLRSSALKSAAVRPFSSRLFSSTAQRSLVNQITLVGHVGADAESHEFTNGNSVVNFNLATTSHHRNKDNDMVETVQWHRIRSYGANVAWLPEKIKKGALVYVRGSLRYDSFTDKDGNERTATYIKSEQVKKLRDPGTKQYEAGEAASED
ncbi:hypothetical protein H4R33_000149 [Dimargaris cristalligena]|uniref:Uncharacterized protein n=1 Tax=Dimargaris cristalligena TaxID=215637 RepID=A0A4V1J5W4_9FUNG|nr:hypothetical protein H4R33_000149 [Dimargaris cristalligena]RKP40469.1 hypothetical protein BJ085DRAFT_37752 [Dimargaris cristalligena]|eukprot:RKP40469.1 hypothetical protein BJ085DRAFT_37752 [Dimargaris cristalligena]